MSTFEVRLFKSYLMELKPIMAGSRYSPVNKFKSYLMELKQSHKAIRFKALKSLNHTLWNWNYKYNKTKQHVTVFKSYLMELKLQIGNDRRDDESV